MIVKRMNRDGDTTKIPEAVVILVPVPPRPGPKSADPTMPPQIGLGEGQKLEMRFLPEASEGCPSPQKDLERSEKINGQHGQGLWVFSAPPQFLQGTPVQTEAGEEAG